MGALAFVGVRVGETAEATKLEEGVLVSVGPPPIAEVTVTAGVDVICSCVKRVSVGEGDTGTSVVGVINSRALSVATIVGVKVSSEVALVLTGGGSSSGVVVFCRVKKRAAPKTATRTAVRITVRFLCFFMGFFASEITGFEAKRCGWTAFVLLKVGIFGFSFCFFSF